MRFSVTESDVNEGSNGICLKCGEIAYGSCEPDARNYECESCGERKVFGLEEAIIMGYVDIEGDADFEE